MFGIWVIWEGINNCPFNGVAVSVTELKSLHLRSLFEWSRILGTGNMHSVVDYIESLLEICNFIELLSSSTENRHYYFERNQIYKICGKTYDSPADNSFWRGANEILNVDCSQNLWKNLCSQNHIAFVVQGIKYAAY